MNISTVTIPAVGPIPAHVRYVATIGDVTSGFCVTPQEAIDRANAIAAAAGDWRAAGLLEAPMEQASTEEMAFALEWFKHNAIRDGGTCARTFDAARRDGIHSVAWAQASAYIAAGWVPYC